MPDSQSGLRGGRKGEGGPWTDFLCVVLAQAWGGGSLHTWGSC